jgi:hypothetical protein
MFSVAQMSMQLYISSSRASMLMNQLNQSGFELDFLVGIGLIDMYYTTYRSVKETWRVFNNMANNHNSSTARIPDDM